VAKQSFVTDAEWGSCSRVPLLLLELRRKNSPRKWSTRKARLFSVACCRRVWHLLDYPYDRRAVEIAEEVADKKMRLAGLRVSHEATSITDLGPDPDRLVLGLGWSYVSSHEWDSCYFLSVSPQGRRVCRVARWASTPTPWGSPHDTANDARVLLSFRTGLDAAKAEEQAQCGLLRDVVGPAICPAIQGAWLCNSGGTVRRLAEAIYEERAFDHLPILADALEEASCSDEALLGHLRGPSPHVRGCWAVDLILGKK
jgi:hypothetical protein